MNCVELTPEAAKKLLSRILDYRKTNGMESDRPRQKTKEVFVKGQEVTNCNIDNVYVNEVKRTVVIKWTDGTASKATCHDDDKFDPLTGFAIAYMKHLCGGSNNFHKWALKLINSHSEKKYMLPSSKNKTKSDQAKD